MSRLSIVLQGIIAALLAACSPPAEPQPPTLAFRQDDATYVWTAAHGATGALALGQSGGGGDAPPALVLTCRGETRGGLRVGAFVAEPVPVPIELKAGGVSLVVNPERIVTDGGVVLAGESVLPAGWFEALAAAGPLRLQYGDQGITLQGPGRALVEGLQRHCRELDSPAN